MVNKILASEKTQTRRVLKLQPDKIHDGEPYWNVGGYRAWRFRGVTDVLRMGTGNPLVCPYGSVRDRLYVRESFYIGLVAMEQFGIGFKASHTTGDLMETDGGYNFVDFSDDPQERFKQREWAERHSGTDRWMPGIHQPRWASRITLEITDVRVQRLQDISEEDAEAEGCESIQMTEKDLADLAISDESPDVKAIGKALGLGYFPARSEFNLLWNSINGTRESGIYAWDKSPWVWAISFKRVKP